MKLRRILTLVWMLLFAAGILPQAMPAAMAEVVPYSISIDLTNQIVTVFNTSDGSIARQMLCSTGLNNSTPKGTYTLGKKERKQERTEWYYFRSYRCYAKYATRIYKGIMFHSIPCNRKSESSVSKTALAQFGEPASHGCIRLRPDDAEFIALNCLEGTKVKIYESGDRDDDLRELLMQASFTGENGMTYSNFLGIPDEEGVLGRSSSGNDVQDLQYRLRALGFYTDEITGEYRTSTVTAVKQVQKALGLEENGYTTVALSEAIFSQDAPTAMNVTLTEGMSGPAVRNLQSELETLCLYDGDRDGIYDGEVIEAVQQFQQVYGYDADGVATSEVQQAVCYEADQVTAYFDGEAYVCEVVTENLPMARVSARARVRLRSGPTTDSSALDSLSDGTTLLVLEEGGEWSKVQLGNTVGYIKNSYLKSTSQTLAHLDYSSASGDLEMTVGNTLEEYQSGAPLPKTAFEDYLADQSVDTDNLPEGTIQYATVNTGSEEVMLNLRETPNTSGVVLATLKSGEKMEVLLKSTVWSYVTYQGLNGYLMNNYLDYWTGPEGALEDESAQPDDEDPFEDDSSDMLYALVLDKADVFDLDSEDANRLGSLAKDTQVKVVESDDDWSLIEYNGRQGYMHNGDLQFILTED